MPKKVSNKQIYHVKLSSYWQLLPFQFQAWVKEDSPPPLCKLEDEFLTNNFLVNIFIR
jgi:hypothetical protein